MNPLQIQNQNVKTLGALGTTGLVDGRELENIVGVAVVGDLNQQLVDISTHMEQQVQEKQSLRGEMETIYKMKQDKEVLSIEGQSYRDLNPEEARLINVVHSATPQTNELGEVVGYRIKEEPFQEATKAGLDSRENKLSELNSNSEVTVLKIQSLVDQRKNALNLLSNLLKASSDIAQNIIGNIRS